MTTPMVPRGQYHCTLNTDSMLSKFEMKPSKKRPDHTTDSRDIKEDGPRRHQAIITRHVDPNEPRYRLPSFEEELPEPPPLKYNFAHDISDIDGQCHRSKLVNTANKQLREHIRPELTKCDDISYQIKAECCVRPREHDFNLDVSDIAERRKRGFVRQKTDMLNGRYDWNGAEEMSMEGLSQTLPYRREVWNKRDYQRHDQMRTDDIAGLQEERERKLRFKYGYNQEIRNVTYTDDCNCANACSHRRQLERSTDFAEKATDASVDLIGQEYREKNAKEFYYKPPTIQQTYKNPEFFAAKSADENAPSEKTGYVQRNEHTQRLAGPLDPPKYAPPPPEVVCRKSYPKTTDPKLIPSAGMNLHGHEFACRNECVGRLPGPGPEFYRVRSSFPRQAAHGLGGWIRPCDPDKQISGFETTWNAREASKLGDYWDEQRKTLQRQQMGISKTASELLGSGKFPAAPPRTFSGQSVTMRTVSASQPRKESVIPELRESKESAAGGISLAERAQKTEKDAEVEAVQNLPW